jgi:prefoldin beta subunit
VVLVFSTNQEQKSKQLKQYNSMEKDNFEHDEEECNHNHKHPHSLSDLDEDTQRQIQEIQIMEQNLQQLLMQKQAFNMELNETDFALEELKNSEGEVFKLVGGQVILKTTKEKLEKELLHKKELIELRLKNIEKQEEDFSKHVNSLRDDIIKKFQNN